MWNVFGRNGSMEVIEEDDLLDSSSKEEKPPLLLNKVRKNRRFWRKRQGPSPGLVTRGVLVTQRSSTPKATLDKSHISPTNVVKENLEVELIEEEPFETPPLHPSSSHSRTDNSSPQPSEQDDNSSIPSQPALDHDQASEPAESPLEIVSPLGLKKTSTSGTEVDVEAAVVNTSISTPNISRAESFEAYRSKMIMQILEAENLNIKQLRKYSWRGLPPELRPRAWRHLLGYLPRHRPRAEAVLQRKRAEYRKLVSEYYPKTSHQDPDADPSIPVILADLSKHTGHEAATFRQISIDVPRTHPKMKLFQLNRIKNCLARILFIWALRHPATSYVQGFNDLCTAFLYLFLDEQTRRLYNKTLWPTDKEVLDLVESKVSEVLLQDVEADAFWCLNALLEQIQDHYIFGQPAIQQMMFHMEEVIRRIDKPLHQHLVKDLGVTFLHFSFRWMNCLLLREIKLNLILRLWDTYLSIEDASIAQGFTQFHVFVCAAFLKYFSKPLMKCRTLEESVLLLQNLPTKDWSESEIEEILSEAYLWKETFGLSIQKT